MNTFRKCIIGLLLSANFAQSQAQELGKFDISKGLDPYFLGSVRSQQDTSIRLAKGGKHEYNGRTGYNYYYPATFNHPYFLGGVYFKNLVLTYVSDTLIRIELFSIYTPKLYPDYDKQAKQGFSQLSDLLKGQWEIPAKKKTFLQSPDKRIVSKGWKWDTSNRTMKLALYQDKGPVQPLYQISVTLELPGYDL